MSQDFTLQCPVPVSQYSKVVLAHGGGGRLMNDLIAKFFVAGFDNAVLNTRHDAAVLPLGESRLAFTTDSYVVRPAFFPGGDIGRLAVNGTTNDLAMVGARPLFLSAGFILEEGFPLESLWNVVQSMRQSARAAGVEIVTGDTKVVDRGKGDGIYVNTAGVGIVEHELAIGPQSVEPGDAVLVSGDVGRHGIAIMTVREGLEFETRVESDCAALSPLVLELLNSGIEVHCLRDLTRGGLAAALVEIAETARVRILADEREIRVREDVRGACEVLGLDPLHVANEGRFVAFVAAHDAGRALAVMRSYPLGSGATIIGLVEGSGKLEPGLVRLRTQLGTTRILDMPSGEQLPRIC